MFTLFVLASTGIAHADRVVVLPLQTEGATNQEVTDDLEEALAEAIRAAGHEFVTESHALQVDTDALPSNANELRAVAELQAAQWVMIPTQDNTGSANRMSFRVFSVAWDRDETFTLMLPDADISSRLEEAMFAVLTREGAEPNEGWMDSGEPSPREQQRAEREEEAAQEARRLQELEREREQQAEEERARAEADRVREQAERRWDERPRYGDEDAMMMSFGLAGMMLVAVPEEASGGGLVALQGRFGYALDAVPGLELRAGLDIVFGAASAFSLTGGVAYLYSPFTETPLHFGGSAGLGYFQGISGGRSASFVARVGGLGVWELGSNQALELVVPEFTVLSSGGGALAVGGGLRYIHRFE